MRFYKTKCGVLKMAKKPGITQKNRNRSKPSVFMQQHSTKVDELADQQRVDSLCWVADWLIEMLKGYTEQVPDSSYIPGCTLNCFAVKLSLTTNEPSQWPYRPGDWSDCPPCPTFKPPRSLRDREFRESLIDQFEELKKNARNHGRWQQGKLICTATKDDLGDLLHCARVVKSASGASSPASANPGGESKALIEGLVKAGVLYPDWLLFLRANVLDLDLARIREWPDPFKDLVQIIERTLFPLDQEKPPIAMDLLGNIHIGDKAWVESMIQELRTIQPTSSKQQLWSDNDPDYMPAKEAIENLLEGRIELSSSSKKLQPNGEIRYKRKGRRCNVHIADTIAWGRSTGRYKASRDDPTIDQIETRKEAIRREQGR